MTEQQTQDTGKQVDMSQFSPEEQQRLMHEHGKQLYLAKKPEGEMDLIAIVREDLAAAGLGDLLPEFYDNNPWIVDGKDKLATVQRYLLNRYLKFQLQQCPASSIDARYSLLNEGKIEVWLQLFRDNVLTFMVKNRLPAY